MIQRFRKVVNGLYRGSAPSPNDVVLLKSELGVNKIISLDEKAGEHISRICKVLGIKQDKAYIEDRQSLLQVLQHNLKDWLLDDSPTYIHCKMGKDRTSLIIALFQCQYLGMPPEKALEQAKALGFGIGVDPKMTELYEKIILSCKPKNDDTNNADVVSNQREYIGDNRDSYLDVSNQSSFAPYLDHTKQNPMDSVYLPINDQSPTRQNYKAPIKPHKIEDQKDIIPQVGIYNNDAGIYGQGPSINSGGFIYD